MFIILFIYELFDTYLLSGDVRNDRQTIKKRIPQTRRHDLATRPPSKISKPHCMEKVLTDRCGERRRLKMKLFSRKRKAREKWRSKARLIDFHETKITLISTRRIKHVPPWIYKKLNCSVSLHTT